MASRGPLGRRGRGSKAFDPPDDHDGASFASPAELHCQQAKLAVGAAPLSLFWLLLAHTAFPFMPIIHLKQVIT